MVTNDEPSFPKEYQNGQFEDLILKLLTKSSENRITIAEIKMHPWVTNNGKEPMKSLEDLGVATQIEKPDTDDIN